MLKKDHVKIKQIVMTISMALTCLLLLSPGCKSRDANINEKKELKLLTFGDSITLGIREGVNDNQTYTYYLEELLKKKGLAVKTIREGISGENTIGALNRIQRDVIDKKPNWVTIMYGTNDAFIDTRNNKGTTTPRIPLEEFEVNLHRIVQILFKNNIKPILMTPIPMGKFWAAHLEPYKTGDRNFKLREYAAAVRRVAAKEGIPLVDHFARWERWQKLGKNTESWLTDGLHPNPKGHRFMAQTIGRAWKEVPKVN